jgi:hypothetical protein
VDICPIREEFLSDGNGVHWGEAVAVDANSDLFIGRDKHQCLYIGRADARGPRRLTTDDLNWFEQTEKGKAQLAWAVRTLRELQTLDKGRAACSPPIS